MFLGLFRRGRQRLQDDMGEAQSLRLVRQESQDGIDEALSLALRDGDLERAENLVSQGANPQRLPLG